MAFLYNLARMTSTTTGTGTITLGSAVSGCLSFADAGVADGTLVSYGISDGSNSEVGRGTYTASGTTLSRDTVLASTNSGNKIMLSGNEQVFITALASDIYPEKRARIIVFAPAEDCAIGDGKIEFPIDVDLNNYNLTSVKAVVATAGTTNTMDIQIRNKTDSVDMLSTKLTVDSTETSSSTAAAAAVIDTTKDDVVTGDVLAIDIDAVHTTPAKGLVVILGFTPQ